jgi:hypothetical protein
MPIDAAIPLQVQPVKLESPMNQLAMMGEAAKLGEYRQLAEEKNALRQRMSQGDFDISNPTHQRELYALAPTTAPKLIGEMAITKKNLAQGNEAEYNTQVKKMDKAITDIANYPTAEAAFAGIQNSVNKGILPADKGQMLIDQLKSMPFERFQMTQIKNLVGAKDRLSLEEQARHNKVTEGISAGHLDVAREGLKSAGQVLTDATGNVTVLDKQGNVMKQLGSIGKPSATFEKTQALQKQQSKDLDLAIKEIGDAIKPGGMLEKSTASGAGKLRDAAGNFIGYATEGSINAASLKPIADLGLKMVPRFEGPQSDKDTASYIQASGQLANESLPVATRRAAGETVVRLMKARKGQFVNQTMATEGIGAGAPALPPGFTPD